MIVSKSMKRLTIVSSYEYVDTNATKARLSAYLDIYKLNYQVTFICPKSDNLLNIDGVSIIQFASSPVYGGMFSRSLREILYSIKAVSRISSSKPDITIVTIPSMFLLMLVMVKRSPVIVDIRDLVWEYLPESTLLKKIIKSITRQTMLFLIRKSNAVFVTNDEENIYISNCLKKVNIPVEVIRNGINQHRFKRLSSLDFQLNTDKPKVLYVGNIGRAQNLHILVDAMRLTPSVCAVVIGRGNSLEEVKRYALEMNVDNIDFVGGVKWAELQTYYQEASILYAQISAEYQSAVPSKLYEYLSIGIPIVFAGVGASSDFMKLFENVSIIPPDDPLELSSAILSIKRDNNQKLSSDNQKLIKNKYIRELQVKKALIVISKLVAR